MGYAQCSILFDTKIVNSQEYVRIFNIKPTFVINYYSVDYCFKTWGKYLARNRN